MSAGNPPPLCESFSLISREEEGKKSLAWLNWIIPTVSLVKEHFQEISMNLERCYVTAQSRRKVQVFATSLPLFNPYLPPFPILHLTRAIVQVVAFLKVFSSQVDKDN